MSMVVDFWIDSILEGYVTEFFVDTITSYSEVGHKFFQGPRGRYLSCLKLWIKFVVDTITSYSEVERNFIQEPRGRYLSSLTTWIKMLVCEKGILRL